MTILPRSNQIDLSIIIVSWNVEKLLKNCLQSIYSTIKDLNFEIFVVDNNSSDNSVSMVEECFPKVKVIASSINLGFAKGNNLAIKESKGRYILLLNPDTLVLNDALIKLVNYMDDAPNVGASGGKLISSDLVGVSGARHFPNLFTEVIDHSRLSILFPKSKIFGYYWMSFWDHNSTKDIDLLSGALMMIRRKAVEEVGLLDENIFMYAEDTDWCYRIKKKGWRISFVSEIEVIHYGEKSSKQYFDGDIMNECIWSKDYFFKKHRGFYYAFLYRIFIATVYFIFLSIWSVIWSLSFGKRKYEVSIIVRKKLILLLSIIKKPRLKLCS